MKYKNFLIFGIFCLVGILSFISADVVSINSGGDDGLVINPQNIIEGIFALANRLAVASNLILSSSGSTNTTNENLTISYSSTDADGNFISNITDWRLDGSSFAVLNMPFDKNVLELTSGKVRDYSTFGNNGTLGGGNKSRSPTWNSSCQVGGCYRFDGVNDYIEFGDVLDMGLNNFTISVWIKKLNAPSSVNSILSKSKAAAQNYRYLVFIATTGSAGIFMQGNGGADVSFNGNINISDGDWHNLIFIYQRNGNAQIYVDSVYDKGQSIAHWVSADMQSNNPFRIGSYTASNNITPNYFFNGSIDEVMIFNRALSQEEIREIYLAGLAHHQLEKIVSQETSKGDVWQVALTPNDRIMDGATILSNTLTIVDSTPANPSNVRLVSVDASNESDADLNCSGYISDVDNSQLDVYINWFKDDVSVLNQTFANQNNGTTFSTILDSENLTLTDSWRCAIRTYDDNDYSSWVYSNYLTIIDLTKPVVYIESPNSTYNYTALDVNFNISIVENENVSKCFYNLDNATNVSMTEINDSTFRNSVSVGPGPHSVTFYCNDTSNNWGSNSTSFEILNEAAISIDLSDELSDGVQWNLTYLPVNNLDAVGNNGTGITKYYVNVSAISTTVDLYVKANGDLETIDLDVLGLGNETFTYRINNPTATNSTNTTMSTSYINVGTGLSNNDVVYLKFFLDAPIAQPAGYYENQLSFKAVRNGQSP